MSFTQDDRFIKVSTKLETDSLLLQGFRGVEGVSSPFKFELKLWSERSGIDVFDLVGSQAVIEVLLHDGSPRYFHGILSRFSTGAKAGSLYSYSAELEPFFALLKHNINCRVFQNLSVDEIVEKIFSDDGLTDYRIAITKSYPKLVYCVQYRESDFAFVSRLLSQFGIFYYFEHTAEQHTLVLADAATSPPPCPNQATARVDATVGDLDTDDVILEWAHHEQYGTGRYSLIDYNFETPSQTLSETLNGTLNRQLEIFDYPGFFKNKSEGEATVRTRLEEQECGFKYFSGISRCRAFTTGYKFSLQDYFVAAMNSSYVLTEITHEASVGGQYTGGSEESAYANQFHCIPAAVPFRPPRTIAKPVIPGLQTAIVCGPSGEEIYVDKFGRVKIQFHWDRDGEYNEASSCWVRVATTAASAQWGSLMVPRVGFEVVVAFEEGDPDRPLIVGSVYNGNQMPPYTLPDQKTVSTLKSNSSKGGGGYNEILFQDLKGEEQIFVHGQKDLHLIVENDAYEAVKNDHHLKVTGNKSLEIGGDHHLTIKGDQNEKVNGGVSLQAGMDFQQKAGMKFATQAGTEIHLKAGTTLVMEAGVSLTLKVGGNYVNLNPAGVFITGTMVMINSGGAAGSGSGSSPTAPTAAKDAAAFGSAGQSVQRMVQKPSRASTSISPAAAQMLAAAQSGASFVLIA